MANELLSPADEEKKNNAKISMRAAQELREYGMSKDKKKENELIELLSTRPTLMEKFFPTSGQKISREIAAKRLQQIAENDMQVIELHQRVYMEAAETIASVEITHLRADAAGAIAAHFAVRREETLKIINDSTDRTRKDLMARKLQAKIDFGDDEEFLEDALKEITLTRTMTMKSTEDLIDRLLLSLKGLNK